MKIGLCTIVLLAAAYTAHAQNSVAFNMPQMLTVKITLAVSGDLPTLRELANSATLNDFEPHRLTARLQNAAVDYKRLPLQNQDGGFMQSLTSYFGEPVINFNVFNGFEGSHRATNSAYYEANKNSIFSQQYNGFVPTVLF
jgi:hypothetical protein